VTSAVRHGLTDIVGRQPTTYPIEHGRAGTVHNRGHAARSESKMVLATMPFPASSMDTNTGCERPGTVRAGVPRSNATSCHQ